MRAWHIFLVGEKGTGKTAYAVYLENNNYKNNGASLRYIRETEYQKFLEMKKAKHLTLSDYTSIWKVIIYLLLSQHVSEKERANPLWGQFTKFRTIKAAIDEYYKNAFAPEIVYAIQFAEQSEIAAELIAKHGKLGGNDKVSLSFTQSQFQTNLLYIQRQFEDALRSLKLSQNHLLFIDGIDIRPGSIPYEDYLDCIKGLANAVWSVNNDFFANIKDSKGRLRVVLLIRPDIFGSLNLQNQNSKIRDNSVVLNWLTTYTDYRRSQLFLMADRLLGFQQEEDLEPGAAWDYYFPFSAPNVSSKQTTISSFISFLRFSHYRPRDILSMLSILKENFCEQGRPENEVFKVDDFTDPMFTRKYSDYLLGEVKDQLSFYYSAQDWETFIKFFQYFEGRTYFDYEEYCSAYQEFVSFLERNCQSLPAFAATADTLLQFLFDLNVLFYRIGTACDQFYGWCFRERTPTNIAPKVRTHAAYGIHHGLRKALDLGRRLR